ncbi:hypothetical protein KLM65_18370 [Clostridioides difficile]|nr:hypothetical protein [Clostridioides difficile]
MKNKPIITNLYKDKSGELCVDINEIIYNILNQIYKFDKHITIYNTNDLNKTFNNLQFKKILFADISNSNNIIKTLIRFNLEVFINPTLTIITVIQTNLLQALRTLNLNVIVEYVPKVLVLADTEIELEEKLAIIIFKNKKGEEYEY